MHKQLLLFHNAVSAYFSGNQNALEATMKQFSIKVVKNHFSIFYFLNTNEYCGEVKDPNGTTPSWIEQ